MTIVAGKRDAQVHMMTSDQARKEIDRLLAEVGMSREEIGQLGRDWKLDADARGVLADIQGLEFLLERAAAEK